jgi:hypothetical protein
VSIFTPKEDTLLVHASPTLNSQTSINTKLEEFVLYEDAPLDIQQLDTFMKALLEVSTEKSSAILITSDAGTPPTPDSEYMTTDRIMTYDWRIFANGLNVTELGDRDDMVVYRQRMAALLKHANQLEQLITGEELVNDDHKKRLAPVILGLNGQLHPTLLGWLGSGSVRVCTENALIKMARPIDDPTLAVLPIVGLHTLANLKGPTGVAYYFMFNPSLLTRVPDLQVLGLVDHFVPEQKSGKWLSNIRKAISDVDMTMESVKELVLSGEKTWSGCSKINCWKKEIEACFGVSILWFFQRHGGLFIL